MLIKAFQNEFGNSPSAVLKIHGRDGFVKPIKQALKQQGPIKNIEIIDRLLTQKQYIDFMQSLDCYVLLSKGEGFR